MEHVLDAQNKSLGRVASQAASLLMGKNLVTFARNKAPEVKVKIINASKADIKSKKIGDKNYISYSGYPGGLKTQSMKKVITDKGFKEVFRRAVDGMLPKNKLRSIMIKNLTITD